MIQSLSTQPGQSKLEIALRYMHLGLFVIPLCWLELSKDPEKWVCGCFKTCSKSPGKTPLVTGFLELRADESMIRHWWDKWPDAHIGILLEPSNLLVIDADSQEAIEEIEQLSYSPTLTVKTGKGKHYYFQSQEFTPAKRLTKLGKSKAIDIFTSGHIVAPGSKHVTGVDYTIETELPLAEPPIWAIEMLQAPFGTKPELQTGKRPQVVDRNHTESELVEDALRRIPADDYKIWVDVGMALHNWDLDGDGKGDGLYFWDKWSRRSVNFEEGAIEPKWRSFKSKGGLTIGSLFKIAKNHGWSHPGSNSRVGSTYQDASRPIDSDNEETKKRESQAQILIRLADEAEFFSTPEDEAYITFQVNGHKETWPLNSRGTRRWLVGQFYAKENIPPGPQAINAALSVLEARAYYDSPRKEVFIRVAGSDNTVYVDLCNENGEVVEITAEGWKVNSNAPVKFRRAQGMRGLPTPVHGGSVDVLFDYLNLPKEEYARRLVLGWLVMCFHPKGPYPLLVLGGEQGSAKSTTAQMLRSLVDPSSVSLNSKPRDEHDLAISAHNSWVLVFDNLSGLSGHLSDAFCRMATGGGMRTRALYSDSEETLFFAKRPMIITGIGSLITRQDLADRAVMVNLPPITDHQRRDEASLWKAWEAAIPGILGAIFTAVSIALRRMPEVKLTKKPRMADFVTWVTAAETAFGWEPEAFMQAYNDNRMEAVALSLESDVVASTVLKWMESLDESVWTGTSTELLEVLEEQVDERTQKSKAWPKAPNILSRKLNRSAPTLRKVGLDVEFGTSGSGSKKRRTITLRKV